MLQVQDMAEEDGGVNEWENFIIGVMKTLKVVFFVCEVIFVGYVVHAVVVYWKTVDTDIINGVASETYCCPGVWQFLLTTAGIFSAVLAFRIATVLASEWEREIPKI